MSKSVDEHIFDVLISYRHSDKLFARVLVTKLSKLGLRCFFDEKVHNPGYDWQPFWQNAIQQKPCKDLDPAVGPGIVILATNAICEVKEIDQVVREIDDAFRADAPDHYIPISVLSFSSVGVQELRQRVKETLGKDLNERHRTDSLEDINVANPELIPDDAWVRIYRAILRTARASTRRRLEQERLKALNWANAVISRQLSDYAHDFAEGEPSRVVLEGALDQSISGGKASRLAIVGGGGRGKTIQLARNLKRMAIARPNDFFPVLLTPEDLTKYKEQALRSRLGLGQDMLVEPLSIVNDFYFWAQGRILAITDGLEQADQVEQTSRILADMNIDEVGIWITCRPEAWATANKILTFTKSETIKIDDINAERVVSWLARLCSDVTDTVVMDRGDFLRIALFLDIAGYLLRKDGISIESRKHALSSSTALLDLLKDWSVTQGGEGPDAEHKVKDRRALLTQLAQTQVDEGRFGVALEKLLDHDPSRRAWQQNAYDFIKNHTQLVIEEVTPGQSSRVRLRHDVIDSHNIADLALRAQSARKQLYQALNGGFAQVVFEGVVQAAHDRGEQGITEEFFLFFLLMVDNKQNANFKAQSWNSGYVVMARLPIFISYIRQVLGGEYRGECTPIDGEAISGLSPPTLGEGALSSVCSMLIGAKPGTVADGGMMANLTRLISKTRFRARLIEAIPKINNLKDGMDLLMKLAADKVELERDPPVASYIAEGLRILAEAKREYRQQAITCITDMIRLFDKISEQTDLAIVRKLHRSRNDILEMGRKPPLEEPHESDLEYLQGLSVHAWKAPRRFSDWRQVEEYAYQIHRRACDATARPVSEAVICALGVLFWHEMVRCHEAAADALGAIDHPMARGILIHMVTIEDQERTLSALFDALAKQIARVRARNEAALPFLRAIRRSAAERDMRFGPAKLRGEDFKRLIEMFDCEDVGLVSRGAMEIDALANEFNHPWVFRSEVSEQQFGWLNEEERSHEVGPELEQKVGIALERPVLREPVTVLLRSASWAIPARAHRAIVERMTDIERRPRDAAIAFPQTPDGLTKLNAYDAAIAAQIQAAGKLYEFWEASFSVPQAWPNLLVAHAIITTSDGKIIDGQRSLIARYAPGAWATSFEEQAKAEDFSESHPIITMVARGIMEEFGVSVSLQQLSLRRVVLMMEWPILNTAIACHIHVSLTAREFELGWASLDDKELVNVKTISRSDLTKSLLVSPLGYVAMEAEIKRHPTAAVRLALLASALT